MPRNGSGVFSLPAGSLVTDGVDDILAAQHNTPLQDIATDLNAVRPVVAGGTGVASYAALATALGIPAANGVDNRIINGDFTYWQRATSFAGDGYGAADRWRNSASGGTVTQSRQAFSPGDTLGATQPKHYLRQSVSGQSATTNLAITEQRIEGVQSYAGQTITILGWVRRWSGTGNMVVEAEQNFGTGGSPSSPVIAISPTTVTLTGSFAPFAVVLNIPSIAGKTIGSNDNDYLRILHWTSAGSSFAARTNSLGTQTIEVDFANVHIRVGAWTVAAINDYRPRDPGTELFLCQRYFQLAGAGMTGLEESVNRIAFPVALSPEMRGVPSVALPSGSMGFRVSAGVDRFGVSVAVNAATTFTRRGGWLQLDDNTSGSVAGRVIMTRNGLTPIWLDSEL
jgi:hypothetical protein